MVAILIIAAFRGAALTREEALIRGRHLLQYGYPKVWCLLEGGAYLRPSESLFERSNLFDVLVNPLKKRKFVTKIIFQIMLIEILNICEK